jgi:uncharacterized damage-inducible protein DinB
VRLGSFVQSFIPMMHQRLAELSEYLAQQRRAVLDAAAVVPTDRWQREPTPGRWSVSQILEHLARAERNVSAFLAKRIGAARVAGHPAESDTSSVLGTLDGHGVSDRSVRLTSPESTFPLENPDRETAERRLTESRAAMLAAVDSGDGLALSSIRATHPRLGELDLYQWILFVAEHERRHVAQIQEAAAQLTASG